MVRDVGAVFVLAALIRRDARISTTVQVLPVPVWVDLMLDEP
jgi:hypothetical protein